MNKKFRGFPEYIVELSGGWNFKIFVLKNGDTKFYTIDHSTRTYLYDRNKTLRLLIPGNLEKNKIEQDLKTIAYTF